ncbi:ADP-ribose pyrophosphatase [Candidatus Aerophobetes bacterium]|uniref:ADP-ribose pyrophosphatase n=1 Tax=Aerophobetes bacterium TaxID=2030807 RepID=A0A2A4Y9N0_UNCAE|nr:MAG: ADP-ribose pyrophosphatase [Candidatus Aerophobetes bacterium]
MESQSKRQQIHEENSLISSKTIYKGSLITVRNDKVKGLGDAIHDYDIIEHPGAVVMVPVDSNGYLHLVKQYRRASKKILLELPAGTLEKNEEPIYCAQRELQEEIGFKAKKITPLGGFYTAPGFCDEYLYLFLAEELEESSLDGDDSEMIDCVTLTLNEALNLIEEGEIVDAKTICGIYRYLRIKDTCK